MQEKIGNNYVLDSRKVAKPDFGKKYSRLPVDFGMCCCSLQSVASRKQETKMRGQNNLQTEQEARDKM